MMVVFTCQNCNGCLKKKEVEHHVASRCRGAVLTCIDCIKEFDCKSYASHVTCVTESEKYGGKDFVPSSAMQKQQEWVKCIGDVFSGHQGNVMVKKILSYAADYPTCPRNKKKFVNFILNNKAFAKFRSNAESAFDLINNEFNKKHPQTESTNDSSVNTQENNSNGKRKKISETEVPEETETDKPDKKLNGNTEHSKDKKKKKKGKKNSESKDEEVEENGEESVETHGKKKKKNKQRKNSKNEILNETEDIENGETEEIQNGDHEEVQNGDHEEVQNGDHNEQNGVSQLNGVDVSKLSKKERKKLLKQQKYEAEKNSIENYKKDEEEVEEGEGEKKAKKKKQKHAEEQNDRKQKRSISEPDDKKIRLEEDEEETEEVAEVIEKPKKFKWDEVIIQVLQTQDDGEMSLKRLSKKVCAEYANVYGERESYEEVLNKFNKKVQRIPGIRVLKDKAKLLASA